MRQVVLGEEHLLRDLLARAKRLQLFREEVLEEKLLAQPQGHGHPEALEPPGGEGDIGLEQALELQERLVVEGDEIDVLEGAAGLPQAVAHRLGGEARVVLLAREALLLRGRHDATVLDECCGAVVIERRDAQDPHAG